MYHMSVQNVYGLTNEQILRKTPAVFATEKHESRSSKYTPIPTSDILEVLRRETGYVPTEAMQSRSRTVGKAAFTKHLLRLRHRDDLGTYKPDVHEVVLVNAFDGTTSYVLRHGVYRLICANGMMVGDTFETLRVPHMGNIVGQVVESTLQLVKESEGVMNTVEEMKQIELTRKEQLRLAESAMMVRFEQKEEEEEQENPPTEKRVILHQPQDFLAPRHLEDTRSNDLYTAFNVIQENMMKGRVRSSRRDKNGQRRSTRAITSIDGNVSLNKALWHLAEGMMHLKQQGFTLG